LPSVAREQVLAEQPSTLVRDLVNTAVASVPRLFAAEAGEDRSLVCDSASRCWMETALAAGG